LIDFKRSCLRSKILFLIAAKSSVALVLELSTSSLSRFFAIGDVVSEEWCVVGVEIFAHAGFTPTFVVDEVADADDVDGGVE
jgi:hypothetical protein